MSLKPWEAGYQAEQTPVRSKAEIGALGGLKAAARKKAGLPPIPVSSGMEKQGRKRTNAKTQEKAEKATEENISLKKKMFLDRFVFEYLHDFNSSMAYIRAGGTVDHATTGGPESLRTAYVQTQLRIVSETLEHEKLVTCGEVMMGIKKEANYYGEDGSSSARVRAWGMLAKIKGMDVPKPPEPEGNQHPGGVMHVPLAATDVEWQEVAAQSQLQLKADVRN